jgi:hypothetical protein
MQVKIMPPTFPEDHLDSLVYQSHGIEAQNPIQQHAPANEMQDHISAQVATLSPDAAVINPSESKSFLYTYEFFKRIQRLKSCMREKTSQSEISNREI